MCTCINLNARILTHVLVGAYARYSCTSMCIRDAWARLFYVVLGVYLLGGWIRRHVGTDAGACVGVWIASDESVAPHMVWAEDKSIFPDKFGSLL